MYIYLHVDLEVVVCTSIIQEGGRKAIEVCIFSLALEPFSNQGTLLPYTYTYMHTPYLIHVVQHVYVHCTCNIGCLDYPYPVPWR